MTKKWIVISLAVVLVLLALSGFGNYNSLVARDENVNKKWSDVEGQLQRRMDLIPNLVESVKGYASHEQEVLNNVSNARARLAGTRTIDERVAGQNELSSALARLLVVVENYPNLKADANFRQLMDELAGTENRISVSRRDYNQAVQEYNQSIRRMPTIFMARLFGFGPKPYFEADKGAAQAPKVDFGKTK